MNGISSPAIPYMLIINLVDEKTDGNDFVKSP
jgi:hypothetical protein